MKSVKFVRTLAAMAAAVMAASAGALPASAADSEAERTLSALSTAASVADSSASTNISEEDEVQAIWISFLDLQKILSGQSESAFTANVREMYQNCLDAGLNTVIVQVRPYGDSFYPSEYFPWSYYAGGAIGRDPGFDPLQILPRKPVNLMKTRMIIEPPNLSNRLLSPICNILPSWRHLYIESMRRTRRLEI